MAEQDIELLSYMQLKARCRKEGITITGTRRQLLVALRTHLQNAPGARAKANRSRRSKRSRTAAVISYQKPLPASHPRGPQSLFPLFKTEIPDPIEESDEEEDEKEEAVIPSLKPLPLLKKTISAPVVGQNAVHIKKLYWNPIRPELIRGSIWENLNKQIGDFDTKKFELHFQVRLRKPIRWKPASVGPDSKPNQCKLKKSNLLSKKRYHDIQSTLKEFNLQSMDQLRQILLNMDEISMDADRLSRLISIIPSAEEQKKAQMVLDGSSGDLVCRFVYALSDFYHLEQRLKTWMFKLHFVEIVDSIQEQYDMMSAAAQKLSENRNLRTLLAIILSFGNYMNRETQKKDIAGFDISVLTRLSSMTSFDHTHTLLMYIYSFCDKKHAQALQIVPELRDTLKAAVSIEIQMLNKAHQMLMDHMEDISVLIHSDEVENYDPNDRFITVLTEFYKEGIRKLDTLNMEIKNTKLAMKYCMMLYRYGSQSNPKSIDSFYQIWWQFLIDFGASKEKLVKLKKDRFLRMEKRKKQKHLEQRKRLHKKYSSMHDIQINVKQNNEEEKEDRMIDMTSPIGQEIQRRTHFERRTSDLHEKLKSAVQQRSAFIQNEGVLAENAKQNETMRRVSSIYQEQVKSETNTRKILAYDRFIEETRKKMGVLEQGNKPLATLSMVSSRGRSNGYTNDTKPKPIGLEQSQSNSICAENEEMEDWHRKYDEMKAQKEVCEEQCNTLIEQLNKMQRLNEDLLAMNTGINENEESKGLKQRIMFLNKEMKAFRDAYAATKTDKISIQELKVNKELNELQLTLKSFQDVVIDISSQ